MIFNSVSNRDNRREDSELSRENKTFKKISLYRDVRFILFYYRIHQRTRIRILIIRRLKRI